MTKLQELRERALLLPPSYGVYQFLDSSGRIIYVGKAKSLRSRVSSYFLNSADHSAKVRVLVSQVEDIRHIVVDSENDALLLENNLIKELQPRYNILLKDSKSYPWILVTAEPFPRIISTRRFVRGSGEYYGPYSSIGMQRAVLDVIRMVYPIRSCRLNLSSAMIARGKYSVCLEYHIGNCRGGCQGFETAQQYDSYISHAKEILKGDLSHSSQFLEVQMAEYAAQLQFEKAQKIKQKLVLLDNYKQRSIIVSPTIGDLDVVNLVFEDGTGYCNHMRVSRGSVVSSYTFELRSQLSESREQMLGFALWRIEGLGSTSSVLVPFMPEDGPQVREYTVPQRGDKLKLLELSHRNCKAFELEKNRYIEKSDPARHQDRIMAGMKRDLNLDREPRHIECFDNSNIQGTNPVASCVVFRDGQPSRREYRHFNIKTVEGANDFASMREVVLRRYGRMLEEDSALPDLIVVDGGKGQLSFALDALKEVGVDDKVQVVGLAKRMEEVFFPGDPTPLYLNKTSETLKVMMHIRDEAHRFGITFHRKKRSLAMLRSELQGVKGLGKTSLEKLLVRYATLERMKNAPLSDIEQLIGKSRAATLEQFLKTRT